jgi:hypothetical protein
MLSYARGNRRPLEFIVMPLMVAKRPSSLKLPRELEKLPQHSFCAFTNFAKLVRIS